MTDLIKQHLAATLLLGRMVATSQISHKALTVAGGDPTMMLLAAGWLAQGLQNAVPVGTDPTPAHI